MDNIKIPKNFFITGTDTDVGKTIVSSILVFLLQAYYWKPIKSGECDIKKVQELTGLDDSFFLSPVYSFKNPLAPEEAARLENVTMNLETIQMPAVSHPVIVEGAGGVFVPINQQYTMLDLMKKLNLPVIVIARGTLGTINHSLMSLHLLKQHQITIAGIIFSGHINLENKKTIEQWSGVRTLFHVPFFNKITHSVLKTWALENRCEILENLH